MAMELGPAEVAHGPMFIGFMFNVFLYGIMITQVYIYFTTYKQDKTWMKTFVLFLLFADTVNTIFDFVYLPGYNRQGIIASLVQLFFAWRVCILTHSWPLAAIVSGGALSGLAGAVATSVEVGHTPRFTDFRDFKGVVIVWLASESVTDIVITTILVWYLQRHKTGFKESDWMVDRIIRITVQTGFVTSVVATLDLILFLVYPNGMHLIFNFPLCKLYTNSLMSSLNSRQGWRYGSSRYGHEGTTVDGDSGEGVVDVDIDVNVGVGVVVNSMGVAVDVGRVGVGVGAKETEAEGKEGGKDVEATLGSQPIQAQPRRVPGLLRAFSMHVHGNGRPTEEGRFVSDAPLGEGKEGQTQQSQIGMVRSKSLGFVRALAHPSPAVARRSAGPAEVYVQVESKRGVDALGVGRNGGGLARNGGLVRNDGLGLARSAMGMGVGPEQGSEVSLEWRCSASDGESNMKEVEEEEV